MKTAVVAVIVRAGKVLVVQRAAGIPAAGYWTPPSGKLNAKETEPQALVREMQEELALAVRPLRCVWQCSAEGAAYRLHWWLAAPLSATLDPAPAEIAAVRWVRPAQFARLQPTFAAGRHFFETILPALPEWPGHRAPLGSTLEE